MPTRCSYHPEVDAARYCTSCGRPLCETCTHDIKSTIYCQDCLARGVQMMTRAEKEQGWKERARRAALFSLIPGIGAVYNGQYTKAIAHFAVFAALSIMGDAVHGIFGLAAFSFYIFMIIDSYRSGEELARGGSLGIAETRDLSSPAWGITLILIGALFTLNNFNIISLQAFRQLWPLVFIVIGVLLLIKSLRQTERAADYSPQSTQKAGRE